MKAYAWQAALIIAGLVVLAPHVPANGDEQPATEPPADVSSTHIPHPTELWPMPEDNGWDDFLAAIELLPGSPTAAE